MNKAIIIFLALFCTGCVFKQQTIASYPKQLHPIALQTDNPYSHTSKLLLERFRQLGIDLHLTAQPTDYLLEILEEEFDERVITIATNTRTREIEITLTIDYQVKSPEGDIIQKPRSIQVVRVHNQNLANLLGTSNDQVLLEQEMRQDAITQLFFQLGSPQFSAQLQQQRETVYNET